MSDFQIDSKAFYSRAKILMDAVETTRPDTGNKFGSVMLLQGNSNQNNSYTKTIATQMWLLGYEFPNTLIVFANRTVYIVVSPKKGKLTNINEKLVLYFSAIY